MRSIVRLSSQRAQSINGEIELGDPEIAPVELSFAITWPWGFIDNLSTRKPQQQKDDELIRFVESRCDDLDGFTQRR